MADKVAVSQDIGAPPGEVWAMVADLTRMGEWSPENEGASWLGGASGPAVGAMFRGVNRNGKRRWSTKGRVVEARPGERLTFRTAAAGLPIAEWSYDFESTANGCRVTETWTDHRGRLAKAMGKPVSGVADRATHNRSSMEETLRRLKAAAERTTGT
jgi:uncharacterized protein YndB with AHSA1/START domain